MFIIIFVMDRIIDFFVRDFLRMTYLYSLGSVIVRIGLGQFRFTLMHFDSQGPLSVYFDLSHHNLSLTSIIRFIFSEVNVPIYYIVLKSCGNKMLEMVDTVC